MARSVNAAVRYLESTHYEHMRSEREALPIVLEYHVTHHVKHLDRFCARQPALCTGEGYRWTPGDPVARFP